MKTTTTLSDDDLAACRAALSQEQARSLAETNQWAHVDKPRVHADWDALYRRLTPLMQAHPAASPVIQAVMAEHYALVSRFFRPSRQAYIGMSLFYAEDPAMKAFHDAYDPGLVPFLAEAMAVYADAHL